MSNRWQLIRVIRLFRLIADMSSAASFDNVCGPATVIAIASSTRFPRELTPPHIMRHNKHTSNLVREAKAIVALAFRNGPIEDIHAGRACPTCSGKNGYSRITDAEMKRIMQNAVNEMYQLLSLRETDPERYESEIAFGSQSTYNWDDPVEP